MPNRFQWILTCPDNNTAYTLENDPIGWQEVDFNLLRDSNFHGVFNQCTTMLKWHYKGGGKQFIDAVYNEFDIDGGIYLTVNVDRDGGGKNYDNLFNGRLNLAHYSEDGTYSTVNIETSDIVTKITSRANIPIPLNQLQVKSQGQEPLLGVEIDSFEVTGSGTHTFSNPYLAAGNVYVIECYSNALNANISDAVNYDGSTVAGPGANDGAGMSIQITAVNNVAGAIELVVAYTNVVTPIFLYIKGQQLSLGQLALPPAKTVKMTMPGITIPYETQFTIKGDNATGTQVFYDFSGSGSPYIGQPIVTGNLYAAISEDVQGNQIQDTATCPGSGSTTGSGALSNGSFIQITVTNGLITVAYRNLLGAIDIWVNGVPSLNGTFTPVNVGNETQIFQKVNDNCGVQDNAGQWKPFGAYMSFDGQLVFDDLGSIEMVSNGGNFGTNSSSLFASYNSIEDLNIELINGTQTLQNIFDGFADASLIYPVKVAYNISFTGTIEFSTTVWPFGAFRNIRCRIILLSGATWADAIANQISIYDHTVNNVTTSVETFTINTGAQTGDLKLNPGDQIWLIAFVSETPNETLAATTLTYTFAFSQSNIDFKIAQTALATQCDGLLLFDAFDQVVNMIADSPGNFESDFYQTGGEGAKRVLTNGLCVRGHTDKVISTSLNDIFTAMQCIDNIGLQVGIDDKVRVEKLGFFYDSTTCIATLPNVPEYDIMPDNNKYYNQISIGYSDFETEIYFKGGLDEIHGRRDYATRVGTARGSILKNYGVDTTGLLENQLNRVCKFIAGNYATELTRRKNLQWSQDDFKYDNNNFIICVTNVVASTFGVASFGVSTAQGDVIQVPGLIGLNIGDKLSVSGTVHNNGTDNYTVLAVGHNPSDGNTASSTIIFTVEAQTAEGPVQCTITSNGQPFPQPANQVQNIFLAEIKNVANSILARDWINLPITPARMLQNCFNTIVGALQKLKGNIQFLNGTGNYNAVTKFPATGIQQDYTGQPLAESASLLYSDTNVRNVTPLWGPEVHEFECPITYTQFQAIRNNPNGYITWYKWSDRPHYGFIKSMAYNLYTGKAKFSLISLPPNFTP